MRLAIGTVFVISIILLIIIVTLQANAAFPTSFGNKYPPALFGKNGSVTGRVVLSANTSMGIANCYVAVVNALNTSEEYKNSTTDKYGNFQITGINTTYSSVNRSGNSFVGDGSYEAGISAYKIYANKSPYGEGYSGSFSVGSDNGDGAMVITVLMARPRTPDLFVVPSPTITPVPLPTQIADDVPKATPLSPETVLLSLLVSAAIFLKRKTR